MTIALVLALMVAALGLLSLEVVPVDVVGVGMIVILILTGVLTPGEALAGFGNEALVVLAGVFVLAAGLRRSGAVDEVASWFRSRASRVSGGGGAWLAAVAGMSSLLNNTTTTALFLPATIARAKRLRIPASRILMPLAYASILGGSITVIGTSTNVVLRGMLPRYGLEPLGFFELAPVAVPIAVVGLLYMRVAGGLLPDRVAPGSGSRFGLRDYLSEIEVLPGSHVAGRSLAESDLRRSWGLNVLAIVRGDERLPAHRDERLEAGDVLIVEATAETLAQLSKSRGGLRQRAGEPGAAALLPGQTRVVELLVLPRADVVGRTLEESSFRQHHGANVVALSRHGEVVVDPLHRVRLHVGDVLLAQVDGEAREHLLAEPGLLVLSERTGTTHRRSAVVAAGIFVGSLGLASTGLVAISACVLMGCLLLVLTRCLTPQEAYLSVEWRLLVLIAGMLAYGEAMTQTGTAAFLAEQMLGMVEGASPYLVLLGFYLLTLLLTQPMSNQATVLLLLPVAISTAEGLGMNPRAVAITVGLAASSSFLTPLEPSSLLVYAPGGYRFSDFWKFGLGLTVLTLLLTIALVPVFWPL